MRSALLMFTVVLSLATAGCVHRQPAAVSIDPSAERLSRADTLLRAGCYDCLLAAYREYDALRQVPPISAAATRGAFRSAALLDIRERELGLAEGDYLDKARGLAEGPLVDIVNVVGALRIGPGGPRAPRTDDQVDAMLQLTRNRAQWTAALRIAAPESSGPETAAE